MGLGLLFRGSLHSFGGSQAYAGRGGSGSLKQIGLFHSCRQIIIRGMLSFYVTLLFILFLIKGIRKKVPFIHKKERLQARPCLSPAFLSGGFYLKAFMPATFRERNICSSLQDVVFPAGSRRPGRARMAGETGGACCQKRRTAIRKEESSKAARQRETGSGQNCDCFAGAG